MQRCVRLAGRLHLPSPSRPRGAQAPLNPSMPHPHGPPPTPHPQTPFSPTPLNPSPTKPLPPIPPKGPARGAAAAAQGGGAGPAAPAGAEGTVRGGCGQETATAPHPQQPQPPSPKTAHPSPVRPAPIPLRLLPQTPITSHASIPPTPSSPLPRRASLVHRTQPAPKLTTQPHPAPLIKPAPPKHPNTPLTPPRKGCPWCVSCTSTAPQSRCRRAQRRGEGRTSTWGGWVGVCGGGAWGWLGPRRAAPGGWGTISPLLDRARPLTDLDPDANPSGWHTDHISTHFNAPLPRLTGPSTRQLSAWWPFQPPNPQPPAPTPPNSAATAPS